MVPTFRLPSQSDIVFGVRCIVRLEIIVIRIANPTSNELMNHSNIAALSIEQVIQIPFA